MNKNFLGLIGVLQESVETAGTGNMVNYSAIYKNWKQNRDQTADLPSFESWEQSQLPVYAQTLSDLATLRMDKKHYLSLEQRSDFKFCYSVLQRYRWHGVSYPEQSTYKSLLQTF